ncbi:hypothetical protein OG866_06970 [Streptomyces sp. NBC_00663]|uniref:hypothetical protein n=1 Tax=Streptomyces sp. NBC_00663 TaxID=2975801 RepID=UPI002E3498F5|nr:hypothetical protein [Streptomyces sp. NBC_00663]
MDLPFNIVPAPVGQFVALHVHTGNKEAADKFQISYEEGADPLVYELTPIVGWCYFDHEVEGLCNLPMVVDTYGMQAVISPADPAWDLPKFLHTLHNQNWIDSVCTPLEAERRVGEIAEFLGVEPERWSANGFGEGGDYGFTGIRPDFRI